MCYAAMSEVGKKNTNKPDWAGYDNLSDFEPAANHNQALRRLE
jgi:hypothetical protein